MSHFILQEHNEKRFNRKFIDGYIRDFITTDPVMQNKVSHGVQLLREFIEPALVGGYYESKNRRLMQLSSIDLSLLVVDIFVGVAYCQTEELFTSVTAQMASRLRFSDKTEAITTTAEIMAVLCNTDAFDINKSDRFASLTVQSRIPLDDKLLKFIEESQYLPPMVIPPMHLESNFSSGYLTHNDSLILGSGNHHDGDICLDVLNLINRVELSLDLDFLCTVEEEPNSPLVTQDQVDQWKQFKIHSYRFYDLMQSQGNVFHLTHKVDKRGRIYAQGYHINTQGSAFKKASIELAQQEYITGVP